MTVTILVDGNNIGMAAAFAGDRLTDIQGRPVGAIFGFIRMMRPMLERTEQAFPNEKIKVVVAWDSKRETLWRRDIHPGYKASRDIPKSDPGMEELMEEYVEQLPRLRELLIAMGVGQLRADRYEADDIAGHLVSAAPTNRFVLMTNDEDWLQLVSERVWVWQPKKARYVTPENLLEFYGVPTGEMFLAMKALVGDKGDDVPGCEGIGEVSAAKFLTGELKPLKNGSKSKKQETIEGYLGSAEHKLALRLVDLRSMTIPLQAFQMTPGTFDQMEFYRAVNHYGFESIIGHFNTWVEPFKRAA